jgi:hypothetical protein
VPGKPAGPWKAVPVGALAGAALCGGGYYGIAVVHLGLIKGCWG